MKILFRMTTATLFSLIFIPSIALSNEFSNEDMTRLFHGEIESSQVSHLSSQEMINTEGEFLPLFFLGRMALGGMSGAIGYTGYNLGNFAVGGQNNFSLSGLAGATTAGALSGGLIRTMPSPSILVNGSFGSGVGGGMVDSFFW